MGWNPYNKFGCNITEELIINTINTMNESGLLEAGYKYINLDDCWQQSRDENGTIVPDKKIFPNGIKPLIDYAHSKGLLFGLFSSGGNETPQGRPGSLGYEEIDAKTYAEWEIDYLKYIRYNFQNLSSIEIYQLMRDALNKTGRHIFYSLGHFGSEVNITIWGKELGNSWRTNEYIDDNWETIINNIDNNEKYFQIGGPGGWNDPDMLEVGNGGMTLIEYKTHFALWAISKAPLIIGCDITQMSKEIKDILMNTEVIAVNQDSLGEQGRKIKSTKLLFPKGKIEQKLYSENDYSIKNNNENICLDISNCNQNNILVFTYTCNRNKSHCQIKNGIYSNKTGISRMNSSKCLDNNCLCSESQNWEYNEIEHTINNNGNCLFSLIENDYAEVWAGNLSDSSYAVLLVNRGTINATVEISWEEIGFKEEEAKIRDLWEKKDLGIFKERYSITLVPHDSQMLKVTPVKFISSSSSSSSFSSSPSSSSHSHSTSSHSISSSSSFFPSSSSSSSSSSSFSSSSDKDKKNYIIIIIVIVVVILILLLIIIRRIKKRNNEPNINILNDRIINN